MNPLVTRQLQVIAETIAKLSETLHAGQSHAAQLAEERDRLLQEQWRLRKQISAFQRAAQDYDALADDCNRRHETQVKVLERLEALLKKVKALSAELRT